MSHKFKFHFLGWKILFQRERYILSLCDIWIIKAWRERCDAYYFGNCLGLHSVGDFRKIAVQIPLFKSHASVLYPT